MEQLSKEIKELDLKISDVKIDLSKDIRELDLKISDTKLELSQEIQESKNSTIKWVAGLMFAQVVTFSGLFFTAFKIFMPE